MFNYFGVTLLHCKPREHVDKRIIACRRAYFALQGAGFTNTVTDVDAISYIWKAAIHVRPVLTYGINSFNIFAGDLEFCRSLPILKALNVSNAYLTQSWHNLTCILVPCVI